jgi:hypothetical protein
MSNKNYSGFNSGLDKPQTKDSNFNTLEQILDEDFMTGQIQNDFKENCYNGIVIFLFLNLNYI